MWRALAIWRLEKKGKSGERKPTLIYSLGFSPPPNFQSESGCSSEVSPEGEPNVPVRVLACLSGGKGLGQSAGLGLYIACHVT